MPSQFIVKKTFEATEPISGRKRKLERGDVFLLDDGQTDVTITIEIERLPYLIERSTLAICCEKNYNPGFLI
jgi:hypothetical protein